MPTAGVRVLFIGRTWKVPYEVEQCSKIGGLFGQIARFKPDIIVTSELIPGNLNISGLELRKRWIHVNPQATDEEVINTVEACYFNTLWGKHTRDDVEPLVSIYTGTYNTGDVLLDTYNSLREQTYKNWEWVVVDDESTDGTWEKLLQYAAEDFRVRPMRVCHNGKIGNTKDLATRMCNGKYLIELDHDDMLTDTAVDEVRKAFDADPEVGMVYTNCGSFFPDGSPHMFGGEFWTPRYRDTEYHGKVYKECRNPNIYDSFGNEFYQLFGWFLTVGPNHIRAYRAAKLREFGGYNRNIPVADDWDLFARFFLYSKCVHIDSMLYLYRFHDGWANTTFTRNKSIQDHMELGRRRYAAEFKKYNDARLKLQALAVPPTKLSVIILDWNTEEMTRECVASVRRNYRYPDVEIVLVQNGKPFDCPEANKVVQLETNIGFAAGCNRGAMEASGKYLCFLNSDTIVEAGLFEKLLEQAERPDVGIVGPYCNAAKPPQGYHQRDNVPPQTLGLEAIVAVCAVIRKDLFDVVGGFDPRFCNFEDDDLCRRVSAKGLKCLVVGGAWIYHKEHASFSKNNVNVEEQIRESRKLFEKKWPKIAVIALTLNERGSLPGYFEQYKKITWRKGILDSGSTDGTIKWAEENRATVCSRNFTTFEEQRNEAVKQLVNGEEWVLMHDPDERLDENTLENIWELVRSDEYDIYLAPVRAKNYDGTFTEWVPKPFLWRNKPEIQWVFPVHEKLVGSYRQAKITNAWITHDLSLHDPERRKSMAELYDKLGKDGGELGDWPILNYHKRGDPRIKKIVLGPKVSVIVPTYRRKELLARAIASIKEQDYLAKEIIVVGDCCPEFEPVPGCVSVNLPTNHGAGGAVPRNYGIMLAGGCLIAYLDDDNAWRENHLSSLYLSMCNKGAFFGVSSMEVDGKLLICKEPKFGSVDTSAVMHKRELVEHFGWWRNRDAAGYSHDWAFVEPWVKAGVRHVCTGETTVIYNRATSGQKEFLAKLLDIKE